MSSLSSLTACVDPLTPLAERLGAALGARGWRVAMAESCTGGWVAKLLTDIAGSSAWFECSVVTYSNASKQQLLGVAPEVLETQGAVSEAAVRAMAEGVLHCSGVEIAVAISGIAGPGGGTPEKPVGTVWLAWATSSGSEARCHHFAGERAAVRHGAARVALAGLLERLEALG